MELTTKPVKPKLPQPDPEDPAIVLTFLDLAMIGSLCHKHITDSASLMRAITELSTVTVQGVPITLEPKLLTRLKSRCLDKSAFPSWLKDTIIKQLHDFAGW